MSTYFSLEEKFRTMGCGFWKIFGGGSEALRRRLLGKKWVVLEFLGDGGQRTVAGAENRRIWQTKNFVSGRAKCVQIRHFSPAHGTGKEGIADDGDGFI